MSFSGNRSLGLTSKESKRYSLLRAIGAVASSNWKAAGFERECHLAMEKKHGETQRQNSFYVPSDLLFSRDLSAAGGGSAGGYLVGTDNAPGGAFIDLLRNRLVTAEMGATFMSGLHGNVTIPKQASANTAYWLANEGTAITEGNLTLGQLSLTPKTVGAYQELSRQLLIQSVPAADDIVMNDLAKVVGIAVDAAAINGSGAGGQPQGIIGTAGIGSVSGTSLGWAGICEFQTDVAGANADINAPTFGYVTTPTVASLLKQRQRFASTDSPVWEGNLVVGSLGGCKAMSTAQMPAANMLAGDWSQLVIGEWGLLEIQTNPFANFQAGIVGIRAMYSVDVAVRIPGAFSLATSIT